MQYSQGKEQEGILKYFLDKTLFKGLSYSYLTFLDLGANDGKTLSNTYSLALLGWSGLCVEPSKVAFKKLQEIHSNKQFIKCLNAAISDKDGKTYMFESGTHLGKGDTSLLSTLNKTDYIKWKAVTDFNKVEVDVLTFETMMSLSPYQIFDFISIDCEGEDLTILSQMNLTELGCRCICLEWNSDQLTKDLMMSYCEKHGLTKLLLQNSENIILAK